MQMQYLRLAKNLVNQQSDLIPIDSDIYKKVNVDTDWYKSLFVYKDEHFLEFQKTKSVAGIRGLQTNKVLFDFDSLDIDLARKDSVEVCNRLIESGINSEDIQIYFSGGKGFHISCVFKEYISRQEFINITFGLASDLPTFDQKINDDNRLIRLELTKHPKTGLYKVPLSFSELQELSVDEIKSLASNPENYDVTLLNDNLYKIKIPDILKELKNKEAKKITSTLDIKEIKGFDIKDIDLGECPKWMEPARYILSQGFFYGSDSVDKGERNSAFMILAATFKNQGFDAAHTLALLSVTAEKQALRTGEDTYTDDKLQREIINTVFSSAWKGGIYPKDEELLVLTRERFELSDDVVQTTSVDIVNVGFGFKDFVKNIDKNRIYTGLDSLDKAVVMTSGMLISLLAAPGAGKTSLANSFVETLNLKGENTLYFSLDLYKNLLFNRLLQKYSKYDFQKILDQYKTDEPDEVLLDAYSKVIQNYSKVAFNFKSGISIDELELEVKNHVKLIGKSPKLIVVDYLEKIRTPFSDATASTSYAAGRLADIAKKYDTTVLLLVQPSKVGGGDPRDEFKNYRAIKGSSAIESESRVILGLFRPGYNPADSSKDRYATISVLKNNTGPLGRFDHYWNGISGTLTELDSEGRKNLAQLRKDLENIQERDDI